MTAKTKGKGVLKAELGGDYDRLITAFNRFTKFRHGFKTTALRKMAQIHKKQIRKRLLTDKAGPDGETWKPWAESTRAQRERKGTAGSGMLVDNRDLVNSFKVAFTTARGKLGSVLPYASAQHFGDSRRNLPARPYAGVGRGDIAELQRTLNDWVGKNLPL